MSQGRLIFVLAGALLAQLSSARAEVATSGDVNLKLRSALQESESKLGALEPWQKKIFDEEAVPQAQRFIRDYRAQAGAKGGITADIDLDALKSYLRFYAPKSLGKEGGKALVYLLAGPECEKCAASLPTIKRLIKARVERRGLVPAWVTPSEAGAESPDGEVTGKALDDRIADLARSRNAAAALVVQWQLAPIDDIDSAHADEKRYLIHFSLLVRDESRDLSRNEGRMELLENDSFESAAARLLTDAFTDLGAKADRLAAAQSPALSAGARGEVWVEVSGIKSFAQYGSIRAQIQAKTGASVEERKVAKGRAVFALAGSAQGAASGQASGLTTDQLKAQLTGLAVEPGGSGGMGNLGYVGAGESEGIPVLQMEVR